MKYLIALCLLFPTFIHAQYLRGRVVDVANGQSLPQASVFVSKTSIGTVADNSGNFSLAKLPSGSFELVISYIGYETTVLRFEKARDSVLLVQLNVKDKKLEDIIVQSYEKNGWERWGFLFKNNFIGISSYADECRILNVNDIGFIFSEKKQILNAYARNPIIIINKKLGYKIQFQLEEFTYNMKTDHLFYSGYPSFMELDGNRKAKKRWATERRKVYEGSFMMFAKRLNQNKLQESGFVVRKLVREPNKEKQRVKFKVDYFVDINQLSHDSLAYYNRIMNQSDYTDFLYKDTLSFDQFAFRTDSNGVQLKFNNYLYITYPSNKKNEPIFQFRREVSSGGLLTSIITLQDKTPITIYDSGAFYDPANITFMGYWAWSEKVGMILPLDYQPE